MLKTRIKLHYLDVYDQLELEDMLNTAANDGWNLVKFTRLFSVFKKNSLPKKYYHVLHNYSYYSKRKFHGLLEEQVKIKEYIEEFGYKKIGETRLFEIYESDSSTPIYTDESLNEEREEIRLKNIKKSLKFESISYFLMFLLILLLINMGMFETLRENGKLLKIVSGCLIIFTVMPIRTIYKKRYLKSKKVRESNRKPYKNSFYQIYSIVLLVIFWTTYVINGIHLTSNPTIKYFTYTVSVEPREEITVSLIDIKYLEEKIDAENYYVGRSYGYQSKSLVLEELVLNIEGENIMIVKSKLPIISNFIFNQYFKHNDLNIKNVEENRIVKEEEVYIFRYKNVMVYSKKELDDQLIEGIKKFVDNR